MSKPAEFPCPRCRRERRLCICQRRSDSPTFSDVLGIEELETVECPRCGKHVRADCSIHTCVGGQRMYGDPKTEMPGEHCPHGVYVTGAVGCAICENST